jgi:hypothetical protein
MMTFGEKNLLKKGHKFAKHTKKIHGAFENTLIP